VGGKKLIEPVTALFIVGLPLFDMVFTSMRRVILKKSPFSPDRSHLYHLMQDLGISNRRSLMLIVIISLSITFLGLTLHRAGVPEYYKLLIFLACFALYSVLVSSAWVVARRVQGMTTSVNVRFETTEPAVASNTTTNP